MNDFYDHSTYPSLGAPPSSAAMRAELDLIEAGFDKMPTMTGNGDEVIVVNSAGTAMTSVAKDASGAIPGLTLFKLNLMNAAGTIKSWFTTAATVARTWTMPDKDGTVAMVSDVAAVTPTTLGLVIGTNVQAYDADLTTWAGVTPGTGVATALAVAVGSAGAPVLFNGAGGTPSSLTGTNISGTAASLTAGNVTTNANLTGHVTSTGNAAVLGSFTLAQLNTAVSDADLARTDAANTFTGVQTMTSPALTTPAITGLATGTGVATANTVSTLVARDASGNFSAGTITASLTGNASGSAATVTGATQASITSAANLTTVGALNSGSITSGFGAIDVGADAISGGIIKSSARFLGGGLAAASGWGVSYLGMESAATTANLTWSLMNIGDSIGLSLNAYFDGSNWKYQAATSTEASNYYQTGGTHYFRVAAAGTAGNNITWTTAATLTSTGLNSTVIGATTPAAGSFTTLSINGVDQATTDARLTYTLDYALTQAANANKRIDVAQNYMVQTGTAQVTQTAVARDAVSQAAACWLVRANPTVTVTLPKAYPDTDYQVIVEVESAAPTSATTAAAQYAAYAGEVEVTSRATNSFVITLTGAATTTNLRWKTLHPAATRNKTAFQEAYTYIYGTGHNPMTGVAI